MEMRIFLGITGSRSLRRNEMNHASVIILNTGKIKDFFMEAKSQAIFPCIVDC